MFTCHGAVDKGTNVTVGDTVLFDNGLSHTVVHTVEATYTIIMHTNIW